MAEFGLDFDWQLSNKSLKAILTRPGNFGPNGFMSTRFVELLMGHKDVCDNLKNGLRNYKGMNKFYW